MIASPPIGIFLAAHVVNGVPIRCWRIPGPCGADLQVAASVEPEPAPGWEHVSVVVVGRSGTPLNRCPNWPEMCAAKDAFWPPEQAVVQFHPARREYLNVHETCLHLWRPIDGKPFPLEETPA